MALKRSTRLCLYAVAALAAGSILAAEADSESHHNGEQVDAPTELDARAAKEELTEHLIPMLDSQDPTVRDSASQRIKTLVEKEKTALATAKTLESFDRKKLTAEQRRRIDRLKLPMDERAVANSVWSAVKDQGAALREAWKDHGPWIQKTMEAYERSRVDATGLRVPRDPEKLKHVLEEAIKTSGKAARVESIEDNFFDLAIKDEKGSYRFSVRDDILSYQVSNGGSERVSLQPGKHLSHAWAQKNQHPQGRALEAGRLVYVPREQNDGAGSFYLYSRGQSNKVREALERDPWVSRQRLLYQHFDEFGRIDVIPEAP